MNTGSSSRKLVTAFFDSRSDAENAIERLVHADVPPGHHPPDAKRRA
jgi:hypothetical protein